ncbi:MAG: NTP transferase domain-containing protein [Kofleriaceae bacterium]|nr:NTP transferase domain-containing protein [Kofleriaceae bacterium]
MRIFFPIAGQGARFGHKFKPFLTIGDETFIEAAVRPFLRHSASIEQFVFVCLEQQERTFDVTHRLSEMFGDLPVRVVTLDTPTRGPAETIGRAVEQLAARGPAFVCDCDHEVDVDPLFALIERGASYEALLPVWPLEAENLAAWSVARVERGRVTAIAEKKLPPGTGGELFGVIGCYGFRDIAAVAQRAHALGATNFSDVIVEIIEGGGQVIAAPIERARFFGDPERLEKVLTGDR